MGCFRMVFQFNNSLGIPIFFRCLCIMFLYARRNRHGFIPPDIISFYLTGFPKLNPCLYIGKSGRDSTSLHRERLYLRLPPYRREQCSTGWRER